MGYYDMPVHEHPLREGVRDKTNHYVTGRDGGRDIDLRQRALEGMELYGRLRDVSGDRIVFDDDLARCLDQADHVSESIKTSIDGFIAKKAVVGAGGGPLSAGLGAAAGTRRARLPRGRDQLDRVVHRLSHRLRLDRSAGLQRPRPALRMCAASRRFPASISSVCRGSTPGGRAGFPALRATPSISRTTSRPASASTAPDAKPP